jgi:hypothetical protein
MECGFGNAERMRRTFQRLFDASPADYRARFRSTLDANGFFYALARRIGMRGAAKRAHFCRRSKTTAKSVASSPRKKSTACSTRAPRLGSAGRLSIACCK